jgi:hypothetical protein
MELTFYFNCRTYFFRSAVEQKQTNKKEKAWVLVTSIELKRNEESSKPG